jgi:hypothetical protein
MNDKPRLFKMSDQKPLYQFFVALGIIVLIGSALTLVLILPGLLYFHSDLSVLSKQSESLNADDLNFIRYLLVVQDIALLIVPSYIILVLMKSDKGYSLEELRVPDFKDISLVIVLAICVFPVTAFTGEINSMLDFPAGLSGVEVWMTEKEQQADTMIRSLIAAGTFGIMLLNLFSLALMPAIAEEFLFRGVFQRIFAGLFRSGHLAIWITAFLFSAIHFQFFGFLPRFILGLIFGYLFFWSGTLLLPVTAHFVNNAFPVIFSYLQGGETLTIPVGIPLWKQALALPVPIVVGIVILLHFRRIYVSEEHTNISQIGQNEGS